MLIEDGYAHSLAALLEKSRAEERKRATRRARRRFGVAYAGAAIDWVLRLWTFAANRSHSDATRSAT